VELDAEVEQRKLEQEQQRFTALRPKLEALHRQIAEEEQILVADAEAASRALDIARVRRAEAESASGFAAEEVRRLTKVGGSSELELLHAKAEEEKRRYDHAALTLEVARLESETLRRGAENRARFEKLRRDADELEGQINSTVSLLKVLETDIERHKLRAPANGRVGDAVPLPIGSVLHEGERLGVVVPEGELQIVADFSPAALGRVREGQAARLRLEGFSWLQYGSIEARVTKVGSEARDGRVRVELAVLSVRFQVPLQHGLPGTLEVEVERVAPAILPCAQQEEYGRSQRNSKAARLPREASLAGRRGGANLSHGLRPGSSQVLARRLWHSRELRPLARGVSDRRGRHLDRHARGDRQSTRPGRRAGYGSS
jgi:hypothetical protein